MINSIVNHPLFGRGQVLELLGRGRAEREPDAGGRQQRHVGEPPPAGPRVPGRGGQDLAGAGPRAERVQQHRPGVPGREERVRAIIEKEAKIPDERPHMASVFLNRLKIGMPLGSDPTFIYAAILADDYDSNPNQPRHRQRQSPYNTYLVTGLPPGPHAGTVLRVGPPAAIADYLGLTQDELRTQLEAGKSLAAVSKMLTRARAFLIRCTERSLAVE